MPDNLDSNVTVTTTIGAAPVDTTDFGVPLILASPGSLGAGFTESVRFYDTALEATSDTDLSSSMQDAVALAFSQSPHASRVAVGNVAGAVGKVTTISIGGTIADAEDFTVTIDPTGINEAVTYSTTVPSDDAAAVAAGLVATWVSQSWSTRWQWAVNPADDTQVLITDQLGGADVTIQASTTSALGTISAATTTAASGAAEGQLLEVTATGGAASIWTLSIEASSWTYEEQGGDTESDIVDGLVAAFDAAPDADYFLGTYDIDVIYRLVVGSVHGAVPIDGVTLTNDGTGTATVTEIQAAGDMATLLDALLADESGWYTISTEVKTRGHILDVAAWAESTQDAGNKTYVAQSSDADLLSNGASNIAAQLVALSYARTSINYHDDDTVEMAFAWAAKKLEADPDARTTTWANTTLAGVTAPTISTTQRTNLEANDCGFYGTLKGVGATWEGKTASGLYLDQRLSIDWLEERIAERLAQLLLDVSNRNSKIPFTDRGVAQLVSTVQEVLDLGLTAGHLAQVLDSTTGQKTSPRATAPLVRNMSDADKTARLVRLSYNATLANAAHRVNVVGYLNLTV